MKGELIGAAIELMHVFGAVSEYLSTLPADDKQPGINAGVSFAVLRATEPSVRMPMSDSSLLSLR